MPRLRLSFLPVFFICLAVAFVIALVIRIRSYPPESTDHPPAAVETPVPSEPASVPLTARKRPVTASITEKSPASFPPESVTSPLPAPVSETAVADEARRLVDAVWFEPRAVRTGVTDALHVRLVEHAAVKDMSGVLVSSTRTARLPFRCSSVSGGTWTCTLTVASCVPCGAWTIDQLQITTPAGQVSNIASSHPLVSRKAVQMVGNQCDSDAPILHEVTVNPIDRASSGEGNSVFLNLTLADSGCGIASVTVGLTSPKGETVSVEGSPAGEEGMWGARFNIARSTARGKWHVTSVQVADVAGNKRSYSRESSVLQDAVFEIP